MNAETGKRNTSAVDRKACILTRKTRTGIQSDASTLLSCDSAGEEPRGIFAHGTTNKKGLCARDGYHVGRAALPGDGGQIGQVDDIGLEGVLD